jgi:cytochrome b561
MNIVSQKFAFPARLIHWLMAALILAMLLIGIGMVSSTSDRYGMLVAIHKPLGFLILLLVVVRLVIRLTMPPPALPADLAPIQRVAARWSHIALYAFMFLLPLVGWGMLSAAGYPIVLYGSIELMPILPKGPHLYAVLRGLHTTLAYLLFLTFLLHLSAALFHAIVRRDGVLESMAPWLRQR